ncbi:hypothetical protein INN71_02670 [Nocardioides sp. ChNu-153]|uniref:hypothetical protein n=1 Tax=unclassified Nocardioides TaxID=2615069 RepID=UPI0024076F0B|nr:MULTISPECIES: hypothetical protein [unclassified Nocardioides]MDF9718067.1 hypothetical protein [Nocardioides sp. ChNu-99]MDN7120289.1 hypothetical protein [Nocardioides sp. ChNu-153]
MTQCRPAGRHEPRVIPGRHAEDAHPHAAEDECRGCLPCTEPHCRVCGNTHIDGTCAECLAVTRADLHEIARMVDALPAEVKHRGVDSEAMMLLGPASDPEAWHHHAASALAGRIVPPDCDARDVDELKAWLDQQAGDELHPLWVLGTWDMLWRDTLEHDQPNPDEPFTIAVAVDYLDRQLSYMGGYEHLDFAPFARDLRRCRRHVENVLRDGERREHTRVPCLDCGVRLAVVYADKTEDDSHECPRCGRVYNQGEFARAKADWLAHEGASRFVPISDAANAIDRPQHTVRTWLRRMTVGAVCDLRTRRLLVWWPDVRDAHQESRARKHHGKAS